MKLIAYDPVMRRPGCALLQAALGANPMIASLFPSACWLVAPTPDLALYRVTDDQLAGLVRLARGEPLARETSGH